MKNFNEVRAELKQAYRELGTYRKVGEMYHITHSMAHKIIKYGEEPKDEHIRTILDMNSSVQITPCKECGRVHVKKTCSTKRSNKKKVTLFDYTYGREDVLRWMLKNRVVVQEGTIE